MMLQRQAATARMKGILRRTKGSRSEVFGPCEPRLSNFESRSCSPVSHFTRWINPEIFLSDRALALQCAYGAQRDLDPVLSQVSG